VSSGQEATEEHESSQDQRTTCGKQQATRVEWRAALRRATAANNDWHAFKHFTQPLRASTAAAADRPAVKRAALGHMDLLRAQLDSEPPS
jgi:hypothetical protein